MARDREPTIVVHDVEVRQAQIAGYRKSNTSCLAAARVSYVRRLISSPFNSWKKLSATALLWQFPRRLMFASRLCLRLGRGV
jgi:hypothetical protein